jgi:hypothetical protein
LIQPNYGINDRQPFVMGNVNSPSSAFSQYYSWLIGLGINFPITGANSYGCQFAVPRGTPRLYMRYNEFNSWSSWGGVIAASADTLTSGNKTISGNLNVAGLAGINNGCPYASVNNNMASGSLTIGGTTNNYGGGNQWTGNTAGLMMECQDHTEIAIHDAGQRLASFMYYVGNQFYIGRDMGWGSISNTNFNNNITATGFMRSSQCLVTGNTSSWYMNNGTNGYYIFLNQFRYLGQGYPYLNACISVNNGNGTKGYWMGRIAINAGGGVIGFYPDATGQDGSNSMIYLFNFWDATGGNFIRGFTFDSNVHGGTMCFKIYG